MPSLSFCGRQWALASDDLPALAFLGALFHGAWLVLLIIFSFIAQSLKRPDDCDAITELVVFMAFLLMSTFVSTACDILILRNGLQGSILQPTSRKYVEIVMYVLTANFLVKIGIIGYGTYLVFIQQPQCLKDTSELDKLMQAIIISTWVIAILYICLFLISYQAFPKNSVLQWKRRIRCVNWCCCGGFDRNESEPLARMALVLERFFNPLNFSATDTLASIVLAAKRQSFMRHQHHVEPDELPTYMNTLNEITCVNGANVTNRGMEDTVQPQLEMQPRRLMPVSEDAVMDILEEGEYVPEEEGTSSRNGTSPTSFSVDMMIEECDLEVANIGPRHRRTNAIDFSQLNLDQLRLEDFENPLGAESDNVCVGSSSPPDSLPHVDSVPSECPSEPILANSSPAVVLNDFEEDPLEGRDFSGGRSSVETTLSWGEEFCGPLLIPSSHNLEDCTLSSPMVDYETLERMHLYHRYALASYGAFLYLAGQKRMVDAFGQCFGLFVKAAPPNSIHRLSQVGRRRQPPSRTQRGASLKQRLNEEAVLSYGFDKENILYRSHEDVLAGHLPYFVALDHKDKSVVVAVRGTWSWSDIVTDFLIHPEPLSQEEASEVNRLLAELKGFDPERAGCLPDVSVHSGMLKSARGLISNMQSAGILEFLEKGVLETIALRSGIPLPDVEDWKFVMTGHSLGAGVVALATLLLKSRFPQCQIECFAICPPGCTMSPELATAMSPFCFSLVHGKDIVPRISVSTLERLRDQMVRAATLCRRSKTRVLLSGMLKTKLSEKDLFFNPEQVDSEPLDAFRRYRAAARSANVEDLSIAREFIPPGKIVFLRPTKKIIQTSRSDVQRSFEAVWISGRDLMKEGILLSLYMIKDHFPYFSIESLKDVMDRRGEF